MAMTLMNRVAPFVDSTPIRHDAAALRERAATDGYLCFRGLLNPAAILTIRRQVLELCRRHGLLEPHAPLLDGIANADERVRQMEHAEYGRWVEYYKDVLRLRDFHALALSPELIAVLEKLFSEPVVPHPRNIFRTMFPRTTQFTTPAH